MMTHRWRLTTVIALLVFAPLVWAATNKQFTWQAPTARENGDALALTDISRYTIRCGGVSGGPYTLLYTVPATGQSSQSFRTGNDFVVGTYFCVATATDTALRESGASNEVNFIVERCDVSDCRPRPPVFAVAP